MAKQPRTDKLTVQEKAASFMGVPLTDLQRWQAEQLAKAVTRALKRKGNNHDGNSIV